MQTSRVIGAKELLLLIVAKVLRHRTADDSKDNHITECSRTSETPATTKKILPCKLLSEMEASPE